MRELAGKIDSDTFYNLCFRDGVDQDSLDLAVTHALIKIQQTIDKTYKYVLGNYESYKEECEYEGHKYDFRIGVAPYDLMEFLTLNPHLYDRLGCHYQFKKGIIIDGYCNDITFLSLDNVRYNKPFAIF